MMTGIMVAGAGVGTMIIPPIVSLFIAAYGWRVSYIILGGMISVIVVIATQFLKRDPAQMGQVAYEKGIREESRLTAGSGASSLRQAVSSSQLWIVCGISLFLGFCTMLVLVHIVPHVSDMGFSPVSAASVLAVTGGAGIPGRVVLGVAADRVGNKLIFIISFVMISVAFIWLLRATDIWMFYLFAVVFGFAFSCSVLESPLLAEIFGLTSHGMIFGIADFFWAVGGAIGPFLAGYVFDVTGSYQVAFMICIALGISGLALTWVLTTTKKH
jgi:predicted MFS family arabinose efflux permease